MFRGACFAEERAVRGRAGAAQDVAATAGRICFSVLWGNFVNETGIIGAIFLLQGKATVFQNANASPFSIDRFKIRCEQFTRSRTAFFRDDAGVGIDEKRLARLGFFDNGGEGSQEFGGGEAGDGAADATLSESTRDAGTSDGADVAGVEVSIASICHGEVGRVHGLVRGQEREIREALRDGLLDGEAGGWCRSLEADGEECDSFVWMLGGIGHGIEGGVDNLDVCAVAADGSETALRARDAQKVAERAERDAVLGEK